MSSPSSRLASFRSYSYYHVLAMCDSSATADELSLMTDPEIWEHASQFTAATTDAEQDADLGKYSPKQTSTGGKYAILINGVTDVALNIQHVKWVTATAASAVAGDRGTSIAIEGSIGVLEPRGITFLDQVVKTSIAIGVDAAHVVYVLKTFFVGFTDRDGVSTVETINDIPPLMFVVYDVTGSFTEQGGTYEMQWVSISHGLSRLPQYSKAVNSLSLKSEDSLEKTLKLLENNINQSYDKYFDCVYQQVSNIKGGDPAPLLKSLRRVNYVIDVGDAYKDGEAGQIKYTVTDQPQQYKDTAGCKDSAQVTFPPHTSIESAISIIMSMCPQVKQDAGIGDTSDSIKYEYKIHTTVQTKRVDGANENTLEATVYYRVDRFPVPKSLAHSSAFAELAQDNPTDSPNFSKIKRNVVEFDYLYTGNNTDILEFDMKVNMGMAYLQTATLANTFKTQTERYPNRQTQPSASGINTDAVRFDSPPLQTFVFFGTQIRTPNFNNVQDAGATIQSAYTMSKHASLEAAESSMKILGNDIFLRSTSKSMSPSTVMDNPDAADDEIDWGYVPLYAKVNIKMPRTEDDQALFSGKPTNGSTDYATDFWFDGYYYIYQIEHEFVDGAFTQTLSMLAIPKRTAFGTSNNSTEVDLSQSVDNCFDSRVGCGASSATSNSDSTGGSGNVALPEPPPPSNAAGPMTRNDSQTVIGDDVKPENVIGWENATPRVRAAIIDAANRYGVGAGLLAMFANVESSFKEHAQARTSSATGLFQFIESTWKQMVRQNKVYGLTDTNLNNRLDAYYNSYAGAAYIRDNIRLVGTQPGDLYLAHFMGPVTARNIIRADTESGGSRLLSSVLSPKLFAAVKKGNPSIVKDGTTVGQLRTWAWDKMAKTLKGQPKVAKSQKSNNSKVAAPATAAAPPTAAPQTRTARQQLGAQQDCGTQAKTAENQTRCGPTAQDAPAAQQPTKAK